MKEWKFKYMTKEQIDEVDQLFKDGHNEALWAFGLECGNAGVMGYKRGLVISGLAIAGVAAITAGGIYIYKKIEEYRFKKEFQKRVVELDKETV